MNEKEDASYIVTTNIREYGINQVHAGRVARMRHGHPQGGGGGDSKGRGHPSGNPEPEHLHEFIDRVERMVEVTGNNSRGHGEHRSVLEAGIQRVRRAHPERLDSERSPHEECAGQEDGQEGQ